MLVTSFQPPCPLLSTLSVALSTAYYLTLSHWDKSVFLTSIIRQAAIVLVGAPPRIIRPVAVLYILALLISRARPAATLSAVSLPLSVR